MPSITESSRVFFVFCARRWYTLLVLRDCSDLASAGWRPPPSGKIGDEIILSLISIAEGGLAGVSHTRQEIPEQQTRKERLVACSCASESLATIKNLATRDVLPRAMVMPLVTSLCHLLSAAETTISAHPNVESVEEHAEDTMFDKEILTQRNFVASNSAEIVSK